MTTEERNHKFAEFQRIVYYMAHKNRSLWEKILEFDDVIQELSILLLKAIEGYDYTRGAKESTYYFTKLKYGLLAIWREQLRENRRANMNTTPLVYSGSDGEVVEIEMPFEVDFDAELRVNTFMRTLSFGEQNALVRVLRGEDKADKRHKRFMANVRRKYQQYNLDGGMVYA